MALGTERLPLLAKFGSKLVVQISLSIASTVIGGYLLGQIHVGSSSAPPVQPTIQQPTPVNLANSANDDRPTVREDRAAMRQVLRARRENPEPPATVKPKVAAATASATPAPAAPAMDSIAPNEPVEHAAPPARAAVAATRPRPEAVDYAPPPPPGLPQAAAMSPQVAQPTPITPVAPVARVAPAIAPNAAPPIAPAASAAPVVANVNPPTAPQASPAVQPPGPQVVTALPDPAVMPQEPPRERGPVGAVFSTLSSFVGHAANATGHTVNWVIDLPGKAIQAGGRVIGVDDPAPPAPPPPPRPFS
jgi:hypothetical protein